MSNNRWWKYVESVVPDPSPVAIANRAGFDKSNITRWKQGSRVDPAFVVKFARAYNQNVIAALCESGLITDEEAAVRDVRVGIGDLTDMELATELTKRLERWQSVADELMLHQPVSESDRDGLA